VARTGGPAEAGRVSAHLGGLAVALVEVSRNTTRPAGIVLAR
jgi:hypothetical protein